MTFSLETVFYAALILLPAAAAALFWKRRDRYLVLRLFIYVFALLLLLRPYVTVTRPTGRIPDIGVFIDSSRSMSLENRISQARGAASAIISSLEGRASFTLYGFDDGRPRRIDRPRDADPQGDGTNISFTLREGRHDARIIITDGNSNAGPSPLAASELRRSPVFTVGVGGDATIPDLEIANLRSPGFGFRNQEVRIDFDILNQTAESGRTEVQINEGNSLVSRVTVDLAGRRSIPVSMGFTPADTGLKNYRIRVNPIPGEINLVNNVRNFQVQINREKIRMLYVAGSPSWEYSFFRRLVTSDPQVEIVTFLILRNPDNVTIVSDNELSLIHFPAREMFTSEIYNFDLLIYDNFSYRRFFPQAYLEHIKDFVIQGGGFIMAGGEDSFRRGGYAGTPVADILPVTMSGEDPSWLVEKFRAVPSESLSHPLLNLSRDEEISGRLWDEMPMLEGYDPSLIARDGATVLLKGPDGVPIMTVMNAGLGRSMALNTNSTWRWCMGLAGQGRSPFYYNEFWQKVIRYMIQSGEHASVQIFPGKDQVSKGERLNFNIKVVDSHWNPVDDARVSVSIRQPSSRALVPLGEAIPSGSGGWYSISAPVLETGVHSVTASAYSGNILHGEASAEFTGILVDRELVNTALNEKLLTEMARASGGKYYTVSGVDPEEIYKTVMAQDDGGNVSRRISWHWWPFYMLIIAVLCAEWFLRRKRGLA